MAAPRFILTLECPDAIGIVAAVATFLADRGLSIEESDQFHDGERDAFYMRAAFSAPDAAHASLAELEAGFAPIARRFKMAWRIHDQATRPRILIAVSKIGHCLVDLLHRQETGWLDAEIAGIVSNHEDMRRHSEFRGIAYEALDVRPETKAAAEARILALMEETGAELLVLARYMQILSSETCAKLAGRAINIHHSFLPSFKGAKPYHQAYARGVKIIGATAHYVTSDLDEGPIIEQAVERVAHHHTPKDLVEIGRDLECQVLARAVRWHIERRVVITGAKTDVFR
ncbi:MAG: formyltetrahydrofolate deformylase [Hyphomonadaceae bacterium]